MKKKTTPVKKTKKLDMPAKPVLFICTANHFRIRFAEAVFNHEAAKRKLPHRAVSRGILFCTPLFDSIHPHARRALQKLGIELTHTGPCPVQLKADDFAQACLVIALCEREHRPMMQEFHPQW